MIYPTDRNSSAADTLNMSPSVDGTWVASVDRRLTGWFYTFAVKYRGVWLDETPVSGPKLREPMGSARLSST